MAFSKEHSQRVLRGLRAEGYELTPDELVDERAKAMANLRQSLVDKYPWIMDLTDEEFIALIAVTRQGDDNDNAEGSSEGAEGGRDG